METEEIEELIDKSEMFKSYYVVWKHEEIEALSDEDIGLNRTMQYGNAYVFSAKKKLKGV